MSIMETNSPTTSHTLGAKGSVQKLFLEMKQEGSFHLTSNTGLKNAYLKMYVSNRHTEVGGVKSLQE